MYKERILTTLEEIKVLSDPFRFKILILFNEEDKPLTVKQMSVKLNEVASKVHYHVKELERIDVLEIVETREKGGVIEKFYFPTAETFRVEKSISIQESEEYERARENIFSIMRKDFMDSSSRTVSGEKSKGQINYGLYYLTDEEKDELTNLISSFLENKNRRDGTKAYMFGYTLFRKFDIRGEMEDGSQD